MISTPFTPPVEERSPLTVLRARYIRLIAWAAIAISAIGLVALIPPTLARGDYAALARGLAAQVGLILFAALVLFLVRRGRTVLATVSLVAALTVLAVALIGNVSFLVLATLAVLSAAALGNRVIYLAVNGALVARAALYTYAIQSQQSDPAQLAPEVSNLLIVISALVVFSAVTRLFIGAAERAASSARRTSDLLQATAEIGQITAKLLDVKELLNHSVELIRDRFAFYHVQVFLIDDNREFAELVASTGEVGQRLISRRHRLEVGSLSVIGRVTQRGEPVLTGDTDTDPIHAANELLPNTRSELALPVFDGERIIGALDVQSTRRDAFRSADIRALLVVANQLGTSIRNARLFEAQAQNLQENKRLFLESEASLREIQRLNRQLTKTAWIDYLQKQPAAPAVTLDEREQLRDAPWSETMIQASRRRRPITRSEDGEHVVAVPIVLRGEVLGAIEVEPGDEAHESDTVEMVQAVAQRLAVSLDRARLFEEAQETTAQEQRINEIVGKYQSAGTVDDLLRITLTELSETLGAHRAMIRLSGVTQQQENGESAS